MNKLAMKWINDVVEILLRTGSKRATKYAAPDTVISAQFVGKKDGRDKYAVIVLKIGKPNYAERAHIKILKQAREPFPVKKIALKDFPIKKK